MRRQARKTQAEKGWRELLASRLLVEERELQESACAELLDVKLSTAFGIVRDEDGICVASPPSRRTAPSRAPDATEDIREGKKVGAARSNHEGRR